MLSEGHLEYMRASKRKKKRAKKLNKKEKEKKKKKKKAYASRSWTGSATKLNQVK